MLGSTALGTLNMGCASIPAEESFRSNVKGARAPAVAPPIEGLVYVCITPSDSCSLATPIGTGTSCTCPTAVGYVIGVGAGSE